MAHQAHRLEEYLTDSGSQVSSMNYIKRYTRMMLSTWLYYRDIFPETAFETKEIVGTSGTFTLKQLSLESGLRNVTFLQKLLFFSVEGIEYGYLDQIRMLVTGAEGISEPLEECVVKILYSNDKASVSLSHHDRANTICLYSEKMRHLKNYVSPLPERGKIYVVLLYNDAITPKYYHPPGYYSKKFNLYPVMRICKINIGELKSSCHSSHLAIKSLLLNDTRCNVPDAEIQNQLVIKEEIAGEDSSESSSEMNIPANKENVPPIRNSFAQETNVMPSPPKLQAKQRKPCRKKSKRLLSKEKQCDPLKRTRTSTGQMKINDVKHCFVSNKEKREFKYLHQKRPQKKKQMNKKKHPDMVSDCSSRNDDIPEENGNDVPVDAFQGIEENGEMVPKDFGQNELCIKNEVREFNYKVVAGDSSRNDDMHKENGNDVPIDAFQDVPVNAFQDVPVNAFQDVEEYEESGVQPKRKASWCLKPVDFGFDE